MSGLGHFQTGLYGRVTQIKIVTDSHAASSIGSEHGAVSAPTVNMIVRRDSSGRADIVAPAAADNTTKIPTTAWVTTEIGASGGGTVTNIVTGIGLTGGPITTTGTIDLANTSVVAASYTFTNLTVDAQGRLTSASNGSLPIASETVQGIVERATQAEVDAGTDAIRFISPARLQAKVATDTALGIVERATQAEVDTGSDTTRFISPARLQAKVASETALGIVERATQAEVDAGTDTTRYISPDTLESNLTTSGALSFSKKKTADESVANSGVVQDDDHLVSIGPMAAGAYYAFEAYLLFSIGTPVHPDTITFTIGFENHFRCV